MVAAKKSSGGGSGAFLRTLGSKRGGASSKRSDIGHLMPILAEAQDGPKAIDELIKKFPFAEKIVYGLVSDGMAEFCETEAGERAIRLTDNGSEFLRRSAY